MDNIKKLFKLAVEKKASDLHLVVGLPPVLRVDGKLEDANNYFKNGEIECSVLNNDLVLEVVKEILKKEQIEKFYNKKDLDFGLDIEGERFRGNLSYEKGNLKLVFRVINSECPTLENIDMPEITKDLLDSKQGLILVTGPTGSGKSTTLAAMVNYINKNRSANIVTLEDPIEFIFKPERSIITQRQLGTDMLSFPSGLKHVLRQDPDVIMIGEMRDLETISAAITLAETGHLILATLHTYSAAQTVDRIIDTFPPYQQNQVKSQLALILKAIISQRLFSRIGGGRVAARELMIRNDAVSNLIREGKVAQIKNIIETSSQEGMISFQKEIKRLYQNELISEEIAQAQIDDLSMSF